MNNNNINIKMTSNNRMMHSHNRCMSRNSRCMNRHSRLIRNKSPRFRSRFMNKRNSNMIMSLILMILNHSRRIFSTKPWRSLRTKATVTT